jgi:hypothetical protein
MKGQHEVTLQSVDHHSHLVNDGLGTGSSDTFDDLLGQLSDVAIGGVEAGMEKIISFTRSCNAARQTRT